MNSIVSIIIFVAICFRTTFSFAGTNLSSSTSLTTTTKTTSSSPLQFFLSPSGNDDGNNGRSPATAWSSPGRALEAIIFQRNKGPLLEPIEITFLPGIYFLQDVISISQYAGGDSNNSVSFVPYSNTFGDVILSGGRNLSQVSWTNLAPTIYSTVLDSINWPQVFVRELFAPIKNGGGYKRRFLTSTNIMQYESILYVNQTANITLPINSPLLLLPESSFLDAYVTLYHTWTSSISPVLNWNRSSKTFTTSWTASTDFGSNSRFSIQNIIPIDISTLSPGSFLFNATSRSLIYALDEENGETINTLSVLIVPTLPEIVTSDGSLTNPVENVIFTNITFAHTTSMLEEDCMIDGCSYQSCADSHFGAIHLHGALNWQFINVEISHTGQYGFYVDNANTNISLISSHLFDLGAGGVRIGTTDSGIVPSSQFTSFVTVQDSIIEDGGHICYAGTGILWQNAAQGLISHNNVSNFRYTGISIGWNWQYVETSTYNITVEKNFVYNIGLAVLSDMAGIYLVGPQANTVINNNIVFNITYGGNGAHAFYIDQAASGTLWTNNIGYMATGAVFQIHYGINNIIRNNIIASPSNRYLVWPCSFPADCSLCGLRSGKQSGDISNTIFTNNIIALNSPSDGIESDRNATLFYTLIPTGFENDTFSNNLYYQANIDLSTLQFPPTQNPTSFIEWQKTGKDIDSILANPLFSDFENFNFSLMENSPAFGIGFQQINTRDVGPRGV
jgi:hypothetical protein